MMPIAFGPAAGFGARGAAGPPGPGRPNRILAKLRRRIGAAFLVLALLGLVPSVVLAHAALIGTEPADGIVLDEPPEVFVLRFGENVRPIIGRLTMPDGGTVVLDPPSVEGGVVTFRLPPLADEGSYLLSWRVTSADGHPLAGGALFSVGRPSEVTAGSQAAPLATRAVLWLGRAVLTGALLFGAGGAVFGLVAGRGTPVVAGRAAAAGLVALPVVAVFQGLDLLGAGPEALLGRDPWREALAGSPALALGLAGLALLLVLAARRSGPRIAVAAIGLAAASAATSGHAATAAPQLLMRPAVAAHVLAAALWIGALVPLAAALARGSGAQALAPFSRLIPAALAVLIASGVALAVVQTGRIDALWTTEYGQVLAAKLALVGLLLLVALWNRLRLTPRAHAGDAAPLIRAIRVEVVLACLVIAVLALWRFTPPPRSLGPAPVAIVQEIAGDAATARITLNTNRSGPVTVALDEIQLDGAPFSPLETTIEFSKPAFGLGPFARTLPGGEGERLDAGTFVLPMDGFWVLRVTFLVSDFRSEEILDIITLEPPQ